MSERSRYVANIAGWADAAKDSGLDEFSREVERANQGDKAEVMRRVREAGLPVQDTLTLSMSEFLADPDGVMNRFKYSFYWGNVLPDVEGLRKASAVGFNREEMIEFVLKNQKLGRNPQVLLNEFEKNIYGGQIISNPNVTLIEMAEGNQQKFAQGRDHGQIYRGIRRVGIDPSFKYSTESVPHRQILWNVLSYIREDSVGQRATDIGFKPGYYEFAVTEAPDRESLGVTFFDYKTSPLFTNLEV